MAARQGYRIRAVNKNAKYKMRYIYSQTSRTDSKGRQSTKYSYRKQVSRTKKYAYK